MIKRFLQNGGKRDLVLFGIIISIVFYLIEFTTKQYDIRINKLENKVECIQDIQKDVSYLKATIDRILEILQGKYK